MEFIISISTKPEIPGVWTSHTPCRNTGPRHHPKLGRGQRVGASGATTEDIVESLDPLGNDSIRFTAKK